MDHLPGNTSPSPEDNSRDTGGHPPEPLIHPIEPGIRRAQSPPGGEHPDVGSIIRPPANRGIVAVPASQNPRRQAIIAEAAARTVDNLHAGVIRYRPDRDTALAELAVLAKDVETAETISNWPQRTVTLASVARSTGNAALAAEVIDKVEAVADLTQHPNGSLPARLAAMTLVFGNGKLASHIRDIITPRDSAQKIESLGDIATALRSAEPLRRIRDPLQRDKAIGKLAVRLDNAAMIAEINNPNIRNTASNRLAVQRQDIDTILAIDDPLVRDACLAEIAIASSNAALLTQVTNSQQRDNAYRCIAIRTVDASLIDHIHDTEFQAAARADVAFSKELDDSIGGEATRLIINQATLLPISTISAIPDAEERAIQYIRHLEQGHLTNPAAISYVSTAAADEARSLPPPTSSRHLSNISKLSGNERYALEALHLVSSGALDPHRTVAAALEAARIINRIHDPWWDKLVRIS